MRITQRWSRNTSCEPLEPRLCLSVSATLDNGDLVVTGDADGTVEIDAVGDGAYRVTDNGVVNLGTQAVDKVFADLGEDDGDNTVTHDGTIDGDLNVVSRNQNDAVTIPGTAAVAGNTNLGVGQQQTGGFERCHGGFGQRRFGLGYNFGRFGGVKFC